MNLNALPAFADNCISIIDDATCAIVGDAGEPGPVTEALALEAGRLEWRRF
jgi:hypothetical protein